MRHSPDTEKGTPAKGYLPFIPKNLNFVTHFMYEQEILRIITIHLLVKQYLITIIVSGRGVFTTNNIYSLNNFEFKIISNGKSV